MDGAILAQVSIFEDKEVSRGSIPQDHISSQSVPEVDSSLRILLNVRIFCPYFNWPLFLSASCLSRQILLKLRLAFDEVTVVSRARRNSTPDRTAVL